jgi:DNA repair exonuclease SbcCD ATPase subunit
MAGEQSEAFPSEFREWLEAKAAERDATPEEILARAVAVYRTLDAESDGDRASDADSDPLDPTDERLDDLADRVAAVEDDLADRVAAVEDDLDAKIDDVRERVVQIKRETDAKAPRDHDHDHSDLDERSAAALSAAEDVDARIDGLEDRLDRGFENYEEILEYLTDTADDLDRKTDRLAEAVVDLRSDIDRLTAAEHDRRAVDDLRTAANRHGERTAACDDCGATVDVGLLARPRCPHCEATYVDFHPSPGFFGTATLSTGDHPALTDGTDSVTEDIDKPADLFEARSVGESGGTDDA